MAAFTFRQDGSEAGIWFGDDQILRFVNNYVYYNGTSWTRDQRFEPGGEVEVASLPTMSIFGHSKTICQYGYELQQGDDWLSVKLSPAKLRLRQTPLDYVHETCTFRVHLENGRFVWQQAWRLEFRQDVDVERKDELELNIYTYPQPDGEPGCYVQFADPQPAGASGPAVPMVRDWLNHPEPYVGPHSYRQTWTRRYPAIIFQDPDGSYHHSDLNKTKWYYLIQDNRRARACHPQGDLYLIREDGAALRYTCDAPSHYHHVCEWGMDYHFWLDMKSWMKGSVIPGGTVVEATTTARLVDADEVREVLAKSTPIELTEQEHFYANLPVHEEPESLFQVSVLDRLDGIPWAPTSEGCEWETSGGHDGAGCLKVRNHFCKCGEWRLDGFGPSNWANPFLPGATYRMSAWVKVDEVHWNANDAGPQLGVEWHQYHGPGAGAGSKVTTENVAWSEPGFSIKKGWAEPGDWQQIQVLATAPSYALYATLRMRFIGRGAVRFSRVRWELME